MTRLRTAVLAAVALFLLPAPGHAQFVGILRPADITPGFTLIKPCPGPPWPCTPILLAYPSLNVASNVGTAHWLAKDATAAIGDATTGISWADAGTNGGRSGGVFQKRKVTGTKTKALRCLAYDQKNTDYLKLETLEWTTASGLVTSVVPVQPWLNLMGALLVYAGSDTPRSDCECRADLKCHGYCQQVRVALQTETLANGHVRYTCRAHALGAGAPGNGRHYDPFDLTGTLLGELVYEGAPLTNLAGPEPADAGIAAANVQGVIASSFAHWLVTP